MFSSRFPNKFRSTVVPPVGTKIIWPIISTLWGFTLGLSLFFMDDIYLFSLSLEQHHTTHLQTVGKTMSGWIEQHPTVQQVSKVKNDIAAPVESFYERELRFGTKAMQATKRSVPLAPVDKTADSIPLSESPVPVDNQDAPIQDREVPKPLPRKVLMMGGSSMKTAMGSLLQSEFRKRGVESIREAQIGTGLSRADVVDWVDKANTILEVHDDIDLLIVQFIGNDCQTIVNSNHDILARYGSDEWTDIYLDRWEALYQSAIKHQVQLVIVGLPIMKSSRFDTKLQSVSQEVFTWAKQYEVPIIHIRDLTANTKGGYQQYLTVEDKPIKFRLKDGVHLSYQGSKVVSKHIFNRIQENFRWATDENSTEDQK